MNGVRRSVLYKEDILVGIFADIKTAVVKTGQGNESRPGLRQALKHFPNAKMIIGAGIAYSNDRNKCLFADVLVSKQIENFVQTKVEKGIITNQGERRMVGNRVKKIFTTQGACKQWEIKKKFKCTKLNTEMARKLEHQKSMLVVL